jgi:hypothetical protein
MTRLQREYESKSTVKIIENEIIEKYLFITAIIFFLVLGLLHDINLSKTEKQTYFFTIVDKDYKDTSNDFIPRYSYVLKIKRFDCNKNEIISNHNEIKVSKFQFDNLQIGMLYDYSKNDF